MPRSETHDRSVARSRQSWPPELASGCRKKLALAAGSGHQDQMLARSPGASLSPKLAPAPRVLNTLLRRTCRCRPAVNGAVSGIATSASREGRARDSYPGRAPFAKHTPCAAIAGPAQQAPALMSGALLLASPARSGPFSHRRDIRRRRRRRPIAPPRAQGALHRAQAALGSASTYPQPAFLADKPFGNLRNAWDRSVISLAQ